MRTTLGILILGALAAQAAPPPLPARLAAAGLTQDAMERLRAENLVSEQLLQGGSECARGTHSFSDRFVLSDAAVRGRIVEVRFLYKEGGPFRTLFTVEAEEWLKGKGGKRIGILSQFGPNTRDHSRWKSDPARLRLTVGDQGIFFLSRTATEGMAALAPDRQSFLSGKFTLAGNSDGVYLTRNGEIDPAFLASMPNRDKTLKLAKCRNTVARINVILGEEPKNAK